MLPRWVDVLQLPRAGGKPQNWDLPPLIALGKEWGEFCSFPAPDWNLCKKSSWNSGRGRTRLGLACVWGGDDPQQFRSTLEVAEFGKGDTSHDHRGEKGPR